MAVVTNIVKDPTGTPLSGVSVSIHLEAGTLTPGFVSGATIAGVERFTTGADGVWAADLTPNADITPDNTYYRVTEIIDTSRYSYGIVVTSGGPHAVLALLVAPEAPASFVHTHDDLYYTEAEVTASLAGKSALAHTHVPGAWSDAVLGVNIGQGAAVNAGARLIDGGASVQLRGKLLAGVGGTTGGATLATLPALHRPLREMRFTVRSIGTGASTNALILNTDGTITYAALAATAECPLDGITFAIT